MSFVDKAESANLVQFRRVNHGKSLKPDNIFIVSWSLVYVSSFVKLGAHKYVEKKSLAFPATLLLKPFIKLSWDSVADLR